jgi:hypothetical protein
MSMAVNPSSGQTLAAFQQAAKSATSSSPANVFGGVIVSASGGTTTTTAGPTQTSSTSGGGDGYGGYGPAPKNAAGTKDVSLVSLLGTIGLAFLLV